LCAASRLAKLPENSAVHHDRAQCTQLAMQSTACDEIAIMAILPYPSLISSVHA
jgi:hypothetical protein